MPGRDLRIRENTLSSPMTMAPDVHVKPATSILRFGMIAHGIVDVFLHARQSLRRDGRVIPNAQLVEINTGQGEDAPEFVLTGLIRCKLNQADSEPAPETFVELMRQIGLVTISDERVPFRLLVDVIMDCSVGAP